MAESQCPSLALERIEVEFKLLSCQIKRSKAILRASGPAHRGQACLYWADIARLSKRI
jgi:hypothetical protein